MEFVSSPYLLVFGNDRVRGTREQMILQVDLVRPRDGAGLVLGEIFLSEFLLCFGTIVIFYIIKLDFIMDFYISIIVEVLKLFITTIWF